MGCLDGKVAVVTGAGSGIGRYEALTLASHGAAVVVNDLGGRRDGDPGGRSNGPADEVVAEIVAAGGRAVANYDNAGDWKTGHTLVQQAIAAFGGLDVVVANAGANRRNPIVDVTEADFDLQVSVLWKGTYALLHHAANYWKDEHAAGRAMHRSAILTSSNGGIPGGVQDFSVYGSLKAGIATLALTAALELRPYGIVVNAILPHAASLMDSTAKGQPEPGHFEPDDADPMNPYHVADVVAFLASPYAAWLSGQTYEITGTNVRRWRPWSPDGAVDGGVRWTPETLGTALATSIYGTLPSGRVIQKG